MSEYIERGALLSDIADLKKSPWYNDDYGFGTMQARHDGVTCVEELCVKKATTADVVEVKHGRWVGEGDGYADGEIVLDVWYCSECNHCIDDGTDDPDLLPNYCPNCGAKMDGKGEGE